MPLIKPNFWYVVDLKNPLNPHLLVGGCISRKICKWVISRRLMGRKGLRPILGTEALQQGLNFDCDDRIPGATHRLRHIIPDDRLGSARAQKNWRNKIAKMKRKSRSLYIKRQSKVSKYIRDNYKRVNKLTIKQVCNLYPKNQDFAFTLGSEEIYYFKRQANYKLEPGPKKKPLKVFWFSPHTLECGLSKIEFTNPPKIHSLNNEKYWSRLEWTIKRAEGITGANRYIQARAIEKEDL